MRTLKTRYPIKLIARTSDSYNDVVEYADRLSREKGGMVNGFNIYFLNREGTQVVRMDNKRRTIELTDSVDLETVDTIKHILGLH